jgi:hypothetical protein
MAYVSTLPMRSVRHLIWLFTLAVLAAALVGCGGGGGSSAPIPSTFISNQPNAVQLTVDNGPASFTGYNVNRLFTSVTLCESGSTTRCQTIDHVLVDTGSTGLRILNAALDPTLNLSLVTVAGSQPLLNCAQFVDGSYALGPVVNADVTLGPQTATNLPIQIVAKPAYAALLPNCASGMTAINTVNDLGANGILGVGLYTTDCGSFCATNSASDIYYTCVPGSGVGTCSAAAGATGTTATLAQQLTNPIARFSTDNNGVVIDLPAVTTTCAATTTACATTITGQMLFGVGTQANNAVPSGATLLHTTTQGYITTVLSGTTFMSSSFIDSGSNGLFFGINTMPLCSNGFYCPASNQPFNTTLTGTNGVTTSVPFVAGKLTNPSVFASGYSVYPTLTGSMGNNTSFDWGLPFFYGRRVFFGMEGRSTPLGTGPLYAF